MLKCLIWADKHLSQILNTKHNYSEAYKILRNK